MHPYATSCLHPIFLPKSGLGGPSLRANLLPLAPGRDRRLLKERHSQDGPIRKSPTRLLRRGFSDVQVRSQGQMEESGSGVMNSRCLTLTALEEPFL